MAILPGIPKDGDTGFFNVGEGIIRPIKDLFADMNNAILPAQRLLLPEIPIQSGVSGSWTLDKVDDQFMNIAPIAVSALMLGFILMRK